MKQTSYERKLKEKEDDKRKQVELAQKRDKIRIVFDNETISWFADFFRSYNFFEGGLYQSETSIYVNARKDVIRELIKELKTANEKLANEFVLQLLNGGDNNAN